MALPSILHRIAIALSDVDRGVYETLDLRLARHPSETVRYMLLRVFAYALSYADGISFSKGGLSSPDEPPVSVRDKTGALLAWIDIGAPSAQRLHKAAKAARQVAIYTAGDLGQLRREAATRPIHRIEEIAVWRIEPELLNGLEALVSRDMRLELVRNGGALYVTAGGPPPVTFESALEQASLLV